MLTTYIVMIGLILCEAGSVDMATVTMFTFGKDSLDMETFGPTKTVSSVVSCGVYCRQYFENCYIFKYSLVTQLCTPGTKPKAPSQPWGLTDGRYYYIPGTYCRTTAVNFSVRTYGDVSACVWESTDYTDYVTAKNSCQAMGANLYTVKVVHKLNLLIDLVKTNLAEYWIGLDDIVEKGVWRWADDSSELNISFTMFSPNNPDNLDTERCVVYSWFWYPINNYPCSFLFRYICEMPPLIIY